VVNPKGVFCSEVVALEARLLINDDVAVAILPARWCLKAKFLVGLIAGSWLDVDVSRFARGC
jgi:hypothetical protein